MRQGVGPNGWQSAIGVWQCDNMSTSFLDAATDILGPRGLTRDADLMEPWLTDWRGRYTGRALALASPANTAARPPTQAARR